MAFLNYPLFLQRYKAFKSRYGLTTKELAAILNVPFNTLQKIESGKRFPSVITLMNICEGMGLSTDYMLGMTDDPTPLPPSERWPRGKNLLDRFIELHPSTSLDSKKYFCVAAKKLEREKSTLSDSERKTLEDIIETCLSLITPKGGQ